MVGYVILGIIVALLLVILVRTFMFKPKDTNSRPYEEIEFDKDKAVKNLQALVRCKTVSRYDKSMEDNAEFRKLLDTLPKLYPNVFKKCEYTEFTERKIMFKWTGEEKGDPAVLMAHFDVVPVEEENWTKPAFEGLIEDGILWGRGTLDTKVTFNGALTAADHLIAKGFVPKNDIYFAFSGQEEVNGLEANEIVTWFEERNIVPKIVVDEGGAVVEGVFPGLKGKCGLIGIAEKGMMNVKLEVASSGGHASAPKPHTPVGVLSDACTKMENHPFKMHITKPVAEMFDTLGRHSNFVYKMIFSNLWLFKGVLDMLAKKSGGQMNALMRTTVAFTQMKGSLAPNVIPPSAEMIANIRLNPDDNIDIAMKYFKDTIKNDDIKITNSDSMNPSRISRTDVAGWEIIKNAVAETWKGCVVAPYLMVQCSDSRHYSRISDRVYRFSATDMTSEELSTIHGNDERIRLETIASAVEFYIRLIKQC